jgi:sodium/hydrogen antiporter
MDQFAIILAILGFLVISLGIASEWLEEKGIPATFLALVIGVIAGPKVFNLVNLHQFGNLNHLLEQLGRITLGIGLVGVALRIPKKFPYRYWKDMLYLIGLGMPMMWAISTFIIYLILPLDFLMSALIGAIVTATDPIAATPVVTGKIAEKNIPERIRNAISFESGANDGLSFLFVFLPYLIIVKGIDTAFWHWLQYTLLWEVGIASILGLLLGYMLGKLLMWGEERDLIKEEWRLIYSVAVGLLAVGLGRIIHSDEILLIFAAGAAFDQVVTTEDRRVEEQGQEAVNRFFSFPIFTVVGLAIPWEAWGHWGWGGVIAAIIIMLFRRIPVLFALSPLLKVIKWKEEALFAGWFGPIAVAALYYSGLIGYKMGNTIIWDLVSLMVVFSVILHGFTATPLAKWFGRRGITK